MSDDTPTYPGSEPFRVRAVKHEPVAERESALPDRDTQFDLGPT